MPQNAYDIAPWLGEHEAPMVALARGVQAGSQLTTNFLQGMRARQEKEDFEMMAPLKYQEAENQVKMQALNIATGQNMLDLKVQTQAGQAVFSQALSEIAAGGDWTNPVARSKIFDVGARYPGLIDTPAWHNTMDNFQKSDRAALESTKWEAEAAAAKARLGISEENLKVSKERQQLAEDKFAATKNGPNSEIKYENPFPDMPWIKVARLANGGIHVIKGDAPMTSGNRIQLMNAKNKALEGMGQVGKNSPLYKAYKEQVDIADEALRGTGGAPAPVDPNDPWGIRK